MDTEYVSDSTIDSPPREEKEPEQAELFKSKEIVAGDNTESELKSEPTEVNYKVELSCTLTRNGGKAIKVPLLDTTCPNWRVKELMQKSFKARRINAILDAVLDVPEDSPSYTEEESTPEQTLRDVKLYAESALLEATGELREVLEALLSIINDDEEESGAPSEELRERNPLTGNILNGISRNGVEHEAAIPDNF